MPSYHQANIAGLAHITGNHSSAGEVASPFEGLSFKMGYFVDLEAALRWDLISK